jgi:peptidase E
MPVDLHLLSMPGESGICSIIEACRPYLQAQSRPLVAFIPWASVDYDWLPYTSKAFSGLAEVTELEPAPAALAENERILEQCGALYISGGNTYLLNHRLHESGLFEPLRRRVLQGLPLVGFSAGALLCGPNILTTHDINMLPTTYFDSLNLLPYNLVPHYPATDTLRDDEDDWLSDYHAMHSNPILALEDDACVRWNGQALERVRGTAWLLEPGKPRSPLLAI